MPLRPRDLGLAVGTVAAVAGVVVGCTSVTRGEGVVNATAAPSYRASVSSSIAASSASSSSRASESKAAAAKSAVHASCDALSSTSVDAISAVNKYVGSYNTDAPDAPALAVPAVSALNRTADAVTDSLSPPLPADLSDGLREWSDAARGVAAAIGGNAGLEEFNTAIGRLNDSKTTALRLCDAAY